MHIDRLLKFVAVLYIISIATVAKAQYVPYHTDHDDVYDWLTDLQIKGVIDYNIAVKTLSRKQIADLLMEADSSGKLNSNQEKELAFWWREFGKEVGNGKVQKKRPKLFTDPYFAVKQVKKRIDLLYFSSDKFQITVNPIVAGDGGITTNGKWRINRWVGGELFGRIGKGFGYYFSARDYFEQPIWNANPQISPELGGVYRKSGTAKNAVEFYEIRGGVTYDWKWGTIGILKDHFQLGSQFAQSVIFDKRAPSFPRLHLQVRPLDWVELTYTIGWLSSDIVDSTRSYFTSSGVYRELYHQKYVAANLITFRPLRALTVSVGNSVIIADNNLNVAHFIPIMFYTALDQSFNGQNNNAGQNSQIFGDISWNVLGYCRIFASMMIDEVRLSKITSKDQRNSWAWTVGLRSRPISKWNLSGYASYTRIRPGVYRHYINTTDYSHAGYTLGHFLGDNSDQWVAGIQCRPIPKLRVIVEWQRWRKGEPHEFGTNPSNLSGAKFMERALSVRSNVGLRIKYQVLNDLVCQMSLDYLTGRSDGQYPLTGVTSTQTKSIWLGLGIHVGI